MGSMLTFRFFAVSLRRWKGNLMEHDDDTLIVSCGGSAIYGPRPLTAFEKKCIAEDAEKDKELDALRGENQRLREACEMAMDSSNAPEDVYRACRAALKGEK
jgi:hypothetical protein